MATTHAGYELSEPPLRKWVSDLCTNAINAASDRLKREVASGMLPYNKHRYH